MALCQTKAGLLVCCDFNYQLSRNPANYLPADLPKEIRGTSDTKESAAANRISQAIS